MKGFNELGSEKVIHLKIDEGAFSPEDRLSTATLPEASEIWPNFGIKQGPLTRKLAALIAHDKEHGYSYEETIIRAAYLTYEVTTLQQQRDDNRALVYNLFSDDNKEGGLDLVQNSLLDPPPAAA